VDFVEATKTMMMRKPWIILLLTPFLFVTTSCKKCYECTAVDEDNVGVYTYPEICATKADYDHYVSRCQREFEDFGYDCKCSEVQ